MYVCIQVGTTLKFWPKPSGNDLNWPELLKGIKIMPKLNYAAFHHGKKWDFWSKPSGNTGNDLNWSELYKGIKIMPKLNYVAFHHGIKIMPECNYKGAWH